MTSRVEVSIEGMHCAGCGLLIDETVEELPGVTACATDVRRRRARVELDPTVITVGDVAATISELGYRAVPLAGEHG